MKKTDQPKYSRILLKLSGEALGGAGGTGIDAQSVQSMAEQIPAAILTLALSQEDAQKMIFSQSQGELYLGLLEDESETEVGDPATIDNLFDE